MKNIILNMKKAGVLMIALALMVSCGKKDDTSSDGGAAPVQSTVFGNGYIIPNGQEVLLSSVTSSSMVEPLTIQWNFMANQSIVQQQSSYYGYGRIQKSYNGPIAVRGTMIVSQNIFIGTCQVPAGAYNLIPLSQGSWGPFGIINIPSFAAVSGSTQLQFSFTDAVILDPNADGIVDKVAGRLTLQRMNYGAQTANCMSLPVYVN